MIKVKIKIEPKRVGFTYWGRRWRYTFPQEVCLMQADGKTPEIVTFLHTFDEDNFEDIYTTSDSSLTLSPEREKEWDDICFSLWTDELYTIHVIMQSAYPKMREWILKEMTPDVMEGDDDNAKLEIFNSIWESVMNEIASNVDSGADTEGNANWNPWQDMDFREYVDMEIRGMARKLGRWDESMSGFY